MTIDEKIKYDLLDIRSSIENEVIVREQLSDYFSKLSTDPVAFVKSNQAPDAWYCEGSILRMDLHHSYGKINLFLPTKLIPCWQHKFPTAKNFVIFLLLRMAQASTTLTLHPKLSASPTWHLPNGKCCRRKATTAGLPFYSLSMQICDVMGALLMTFRHCLLAIAMNTHALWKRLSLSWIVTNWTQVSSHRLPHLLIWIQHNNISPSKKPTDKVKKKPETSFTQNKTSSFKCHWCGSTNHAPSNCPLKDKVPHSEWFKETGHKPSNKPSHTQTDSNHDDSTCGSASKPKSNSRGGREAKKNGCNLMIHNQTSCNTQLIAYKII